MISVTSEPAVNRREHLAVIDAVRGVAAMAVAWFHFTGNPAFRGSLVQSTGRKGWLGVEAFFVVSGFVIPYSLYKGGYRTREHWKRFIAKRIIRLDPPYLAAIAVSLILAYASAMAPGFRGASPHHTAKQLLLHIGYLNAFFGYEWVNPVFWTLALEFQFYLAMVLLFPLISNGNRGVRFGVLIGLAALAIALPATPLLFQWLPLFGLGIVTFQYETRMWGRGVYLTLLVAMAGICYAIFGIAITSVGFVTACSLAFVRIPSIRVFSFLGAISYSLYLLHVPIGGRVVNLATRLPLTPITVASALAAAVIVSLAASYTLYRLVELPAQQWSSRIRYASRERSGDARALTEAESDAEAMFEEREAPVL